MMQTKHTVLWSAAVLVMNLPALGAGLPLDRKDVELPKLQMPDEFAMVFSFGYVGDDMPKEPATFEHLLKNMQRVGINTIHCKYLDWRLPLCEKYKVKMMIDLAVPEHDLKQSKLCAADDAKAATDLSKAAAEFAAVKAELDKVSALLKTPGGTDKATLENRRAELERRKAVMICANVKAICEKVRGSKGVWGYGLWYDNGTHGAFLNHAVEKLRRWDPTHVTFVGSYRHGGLETVTINPGCYGWYDFHWQRGTHWHYLDMKVLHDICRRRNAIPGCYARYSGFRQDLFTVNQTVAAGAKLELWFIGGPFGRDDHKWHEEQDLVKIAAEFRYIYRELMLIGLPAAYYSTPVTKTHDNKPLAQPTIPRWFEGFPEDFWVQVLSGEAMLGFFKYADGTDAVYIANHNAFTPQNMRMKFNVEGEFAVKMFDRKNGGWKALDRNSKTVSFELAAGGGELLKIER